MFWQPWQEIRFCFWCWWGFVLKSSIAGCGCDPRRSHPGSDWTDWWWVLEKSRRKRPCVWHYFRNTLHKMYLPKPKPALASVPRSLPVVTPWSQWTSPWIAHVQSVQSYAVPAGVETPFFSFSTISTFQSLLYSFVQHWGRVGSPGPTFPVLGALQTCVQSLSSPHTANEDDLYRTCINAEKHWGFHVFHSSPWSPCVPGLRGLKTHSITLGTRHISLPAQLPLVQPRDLVLNAKPHTGAWAPLASAGLRHIFKIRACALLGNAEFGLRWQSPQWQSLCLTPAIGAPGDNSCFFEGAFEASWDQARGDFRPLRFSRRCSVGKDPPN